MMKLWSIFQFELAYHVRATSTWLYLGVLLVFTIVMDGLTTPGDGVIINNTFHIIATVVLGGFIWLVIGGSLAGEAAARDVQTRIHPLTYAQPVSKRAYLAGRFLAVFAVNALLVLFLPVGVLFSFYALGIDQDGFGAFTLLPYLNVYFFIALPNAFIVTGLQFSLAALSRSVASSYFASFLLAFLAQIFAITVAKLFGNWDLVKLLDPVGISGIMGNEMQTWTASDKNTRLLPLDGMLLWNRILWVGIAIAFLSFTYIRFNFSNIGAERVSRFSFWRRRQNDRTVMENPIARTKAIEVPQVNRQFGFSMYLYQTAKIALVSFGKIARNAAGLTLVAAIALISVFFTERIISQFNIQILPSTQQVLMYLATPLSNINSPWVVIPLLILYFSAQLVWSERESRLTDIADATPVHEWVLFSGKFLGLALIIIVWMTLMIIGGILMQLRAGYANIEIGLYIRILLGLQLTNYLLFAMLSLVVHIIVNQKYISHLVMLVVLMFIAFPSAFGVEHTMLIFGSDPGWSYSDMRGFASTLGPWLWFKLYWVAWALLLAVAARLLWARGREHNFSDRLRFLKRRFTKSTTWVVVAALGLLVICGGFIFYNTNVVNAYRTSTDMLELKAEYEQRYGQYRNVVQPEIIATRLHVGIFPEEQELEIRGAYTLFNRDSVSIDTIHIGSYSGSPISKLRFNRAGTQLISDEALGYYIYRLNEPLNPGDSIQLTFVVHYQQLGFGHKLENPLVVENGTYFTNYDLLPAIGYQRQREIKDPVKRKELNLPARPVLASLFDSVARKKSLMTGQNSFEAIVSTSANEVAVAPGALIKSWTENNRSYFHYKTDNPIGTEFAILSGDYALHESNWNNVAIKVYHHANHTHNLDRMLRSVKASLEYFTQQFGPYPYGHLTLVERAGSGGGASADASMINYGETYALMNPDDSPNGLDLPFYIMAHEVAHQWWGLSRLTPAHVEGAGVLIEGLAVYSGMQVLEEIYGDGHLQRYVDFLHSEFEMPRSLATPGLLQANESFLYYRKGGLAMYALSKYVGKEKVNMALKNLLEKRTSEEIPKPTTIDLSRELQAVTPDSLQYLLHDWFEANTYWRLKAKQSSASQVDSSIWNVTLRIHAQKIVVDSAGNESEVHMNDWLQVGVYEGNDSSSTPLYLRMHRISSGEQTITIRVPRQPSHAGIDPNHLTIDVRRDDNMIEIDND